MQLNFHDFIFPLVGLEKDKESDVLEKKEIFGTAFYILEGYFITAGHVVQNANNCEKAGVGYMIGERYRINFLTDYEIFEDIDLAIIRVEHVIPTTKAIRWNLEYPNLLTDIMAIGYPYGLNRADRTIKTRAFKGHIISVSKFMRLKNNPISLELSFQCPRGLSGAPVINVNTESIIGIVIGNEQTEMEVLREKEVISSEKVETYIKSEVFSYGIAITINELVKQKSKFFNQVIEAYLKSQKIL